MVFNAECGMRNAECGMWNAKRDILRRDQFHHWQAFYLHPVNCQLLTLSKFAGKRSLLFVALQVE